MPLVVASSFISARASATSEAADAGTSGALSRDRARVYMPDGPAEVVDSGLSKSPVEEAPFSPLWLLLARLPTSLDLYFSEA